jgi:hypothetical protein
MSKSITGAEVFAAGTHNGLTFNEDDLDGIVKAFDQLNAAGRVPLKFGHNNEQPFTDGQPALGWVQRLWRDGKKLFADFVGMPTVVFDAVKAGLYKQVSIELLKDTSREGDRYPWVLDAVALLGADIPAVKGLRDLQTLTMTREIPGIRFEGVAAFTSESKFTNHSGDRNTMTDEEIKALRERAEKAEKALADEQKARFSEKLTRHRAEVVSLLDKAIEEGRILPRVKDKIVNSRYFTSDETAMSWYSIDAVKEEIKSETRSDFREKPAGSRASFAANRGEDDESKLTGKPVADIVTFRAQKECVRLGGKINDYDDMVAATERVLKSDPKLHRQYLDNANAPFDASVA